MGRDGGRVVGEHAAKPFAVARPTCSQSPGSCRGSAESGVAHVSRAMRVSLIPFVSNFVAFVTALLLLYNI